MPPDSGFAKVPSLAILPDEEIIFRKLMSSRARGAREPRRFSGGPGKSYDGFGFESYSSRNRSRDRSVLLRALFLANCKEQSREQAH